MELSYGRGSIKALFRWEDTVAKHCFCVCLGIICLLGAQPATSSTWYITPDGTGDAPTIQAGIDSAAVGDTVLVASGEYAGPDPYAIDFHGVDLVLTSESGPDSTRVFSRINFHSGETPAAIVEGFRIDHCDDEIEGGGIRIVYSSPTIRKCHFLDCSSHYTLGNGIYCLASSSIIDSCLFQANSSENASGAALYVGGGCSLSVSKSDFRLNVANDAHGGAVYIASSTVAFSEIRFENNYTMSFDLYHGAALYAVAADLSFEQCTFTGNESFGIGSSGAIYGEDCSLTFELCEITDNLAPSGEGGGIHSNQTSLTVLGCTIAGNLAGRGAGSYSIGGSTIYRNSTIGDNAVTAGGTGGGIRCEHGDLHLDNCRISGNSAGNGGGVSVRDGDADIINCALFRNVADAGGALLHDEGSLLHVANSTFTQNMGAYGASMLLNVDAAVIENTIIAFEGAGSSVECLMYQSVQVTCSDYYDNPGGNFIGCGTVDDSLSGNFSEDPVFCSLVVDNLTLDAASPCLSGNHPDGMDCGLVGAYEQGCDIYASIAEDPALPSRARGLVVLPNPSVGEATLRYSLPQSEGGATIHVYDIGGRVIRSLRARGRAGVLTWDGRNESGSHVAAGVYFVRLSDGKRTESRRVTVMR
jgi:predicted outer membrane repeat protein